MSRFTALEVEVDAPAFSRDARLSCEFLLHRKVVSWCCSFLCALPLLDDAGPVCDEVSAEALDSSLFAGKLVTFRAWSAS